MTTSQEMDQQFGESEIERRLKDLEDKVRAYEEGGMDLFRNFGYVQLGDQLPRLDPDGITFAAPEAGTGPTTAPDGARLIWRREAFTGDVVADIAGAHSTPGGVVDQNALYLRAYESNDWADVKIGAWDPVAEDWLTIFGVRAATSSTFRLYAEDENDNFFFTVSRTDDDNYVASIRRGGALVEFIHDANTEWVDLTDGGATALHSHSAASQTVALSFIIDGGGSTITTGQKGHLEVPFGMTITGWTILADQSGSIVVDVWKDTYANFPPTVADTIAGSEKPTLSSAQKNQDLTLSTWTTSVAAGDILAFNVDSATTVQRVLVSIRGTRT